MAVSTFEILLPELHQARLQLTRVRGCRRSDRRRPQTIGAGFLSVVGQIPVADRLRLLFKSRHPYGGRAPVSIVKRLQSANGAGRVRTWRGELGVNRSSIGASRRDISHLTLPFLINAA
jgi:hypothetical protein